MTSGREPTVCRAPARKDNEKEEKGKEEEERETPVEVGDVELLDVELKREVGRLLLLVLGEAEEEGEDEGPLAPVVLLRKPGKAHLMPSRCLRSRQEFLWSRSMVNYINTINAYK